MLQKNLEGLAACERPPATDIELIVVDNNSTDNTKNVVSLFSEQSLLPVRYVFEHRQGLSWARNAGIALARGDVISIIDDDTIPDRQFLIAVKREFESRSHKGIIGGRVELWDATDLPLTIKTDVIEERMTATRHPSGLMHGCNMSIHRSVAAAIGGFDRRLGVGTPALASEDLDFYYRAHRNGFEVIYAPSILVYHNHGRKTAAAAKALTRAYQIGRGAFYAKHWWAGDRRIRRYAYWEYLNGVKRTLAALPDVSEAKGELSVLLNYSRGALRFLRSRERAGPRPEAIAV